MQTDTHSEVSLVLLVNCWGGGYEAQKTNPERRQEYGRKRKWTPFALIHRHSGLPFGSIRCLLNDRLQAKSGCLRLVLTESTGAGLVVPSQQITRAPRFLAHYFPRFRATQGATSLHPLICFHSWDRICRSAFFQCIVRVRCCFYLPFAKPRGSLAGCVIPPPPLLLVWLCFFIHPSPLPSVSKTEMSFGLLFFLLFIIIPCVDIPMKRGSVGLPRLQKRIVVWRFPVFSGGGCFCF